MLPLSADTTFYGFSQYVYFCYFKPLLLCEFKNYYFVTFGEWLMMERLWYFDNYSSSLIIWLFNHLII